MGMFRHDMYNGMQEDSQSRRVLTFPPRSDLCLLAQLKDGYESVISLPPNAPKKNDNGELIIATPHKLGLGYPLIPIRRCGADIGDGRICKGTTVC